MKDTTKSLTDTHTSAHTSTRKTFRKLNVIIACEDFKLLQKVLHTTKITYIN